MPSEKDRAQTPPSTGSTSSPTRRAEVPIPPVSPTGASANEVSSKLPVGEGDSPLDFVNKALGKTPAPDIEPQEVADKVAAGRIPAAGPQNTPGVESDTGIVTLDKILNAGKVVPPPPPKKEEVPKEPTSLFDTPPETPEEKKEPEEPPEEEVPEELTESEAKSFKSLRALVGTTKKQLKATEEEKKKLEQKVLEYETGAVVPELFKNLKQRVDELEPLEKIHNLKNSKHYKEKFLKPIAKMEESLVSLGKDYEIPPDVIKEASKLKGAALNEFLSDHFNTAGIVDAKKILEPLQTLRAEMEAAEAEPVKALANLESSTSEAEEALRAERRAKFASTAKSTWVKALLNLRKQGKADVLIPRDGDDEHNQKFVLPLQAKAATDFGQFVTAFEELGMEELPERIALPLANMVALAHSAGTANEALRILNEKYESLLKSTKHITPLLRPNVGGGLVSSGPAPAKEPGTPLEAGDMLINSVLQSRGN